MPPRKTDTEPSLRRALRDVPSEYLFCRDLRHAWEVEADYHVSTVATKYEVIRVLRCSRCGCLRQDAFQPSRGEGLVRVACRYSYPADYLLTGKNVPRGNKPVSVIRAEQYRRVLTSLATEKNGEER